METFDGGRLLTGLWEAVDTWDHNPSDQRRMRTCCKQMVGVLAGCSGETTQERWEDFEAGVWPDWLAGENRVGGNTWRWGSWAVVLSRAARPGWGYMATGRVGQWLTHLPTDDSLAVEAVRLAETVEDLSWVSSRGREVAVTLGVRVLLVGGHLRLEEITEEDLARIPAATKGQDAFEAALWRMGLLDRTPRRGATRRLRAGRLSAAELVAQSDIPTRFTDVTVAYLDAYQSRVSDVYATLRHKQIAIAHFWRFIDTHHPEVTSSAEVTPALARGFVSYAIERARQVRRRPGEGDKTTATPG